MTSSTNDSDLTGGISHQDADLAGLPKVELHVHLEGAIPRNLLLPLAQSHDLADALPPITWDRPGYRWESPWHWYDCIRSVSDVCLKTPHDYRRVAAAYFVSLAQEGAIYVELSVALERLEGLECSSEEVLLAICRAADAAPIETGIIAALDYRTSPPRLLEQVRLAASLKQEGVVGIDLQGVPKTPMVDLAEAFALARRLGLGCRAHAGEFQNPRSVWQALDVLQVDRIAHGTRAIEDPRLVEHLASAGVALDLCLTSNVALHVVPSQQEHPVRRLFDAGIPINLSSDDPLFFTTTLGTEYVLASRVHGFSPSQLVQITRSGIEHAFAPPSVKARLLARLDAWPEDGEGRGSEEG